jgi:hypothetical protein
MTIITSPRRKSIAFSRGRAGTPAACEISRAVAELGSASAASMYLSSLISIRCLAVLQLIAVDARHDRRRIDARCRLGAAREGGVAQYVKRT